MVPPLVAHRAIGHAAQLVVGRLDQVAHVSVPGLQATLNDSIWAALILLLPSRVGFLAVVALWYVMQTARSAPVTLRPGDRYFPSSVVVLGTLVTLGIWSYRAVAGGP